MVPTQDPAGGRLLVHSLSWSVASSLDGAWAGPVLWVFCSFPALTPLALLSPHLVWSYIGGVEVGVGRGLQQSR